MIRETRTMLADLCDKGGWNTHIAFPDDVTQIPCVVVGRPAINRQDQQHALTVPVWTIGRAVGNDDAQHELDDVTDRILELLDDPQCTVTFVEPLTRLVGSNTYPAYRIDVLVGVYVC